MFPISIISQYGNIVLKPRIKKMRITNSSYIFLTDTNNLYMAGTGCAGDGNTFSTFRMNPVLVKYNVKDFWFSNNANCLYVSTIDNKLYWCGNKTHRSNGTDTTESTSFTEETIFSGTPIKDIIITGTSIYVLTSEGAVWLIGNKRAYNGSTTASSAWTNIITSNVNLIAYNTTNFIAVLDTGEVNAGGQNIENILNSSAASSTFYSYPVTVGTMALNCTMLQQHQYGFRYNNGTTGVLYGKGYGQPGIFGLGNTSSITINDRSISATYPNASSILHYSSVESGYTSVNRSYYYTSSALYWVGAYNNSGSGSTSNTSTYSSITVPFDVSKLIYLDVTASNTVAYTSDGKVYVAGQFYGNNNTLAVYSTFTDVSDMLKFDWDLPTSRDEIL